MLVFNVKEGRKIFQQASTVASGKLGAAALWISHKELMSHDGRSARRGQASSWLRLWPKVSDVHCTVLFFLKRIFKVAI